MRYCLYTFSQVTALVSSMRCQKQLLHALMLAVCWSDGVPPGHQWRQQHLGAHHAGPIPEQTWPQKAWSTRPSPVSLVLLPLTLGKHQ